LLRCSFLEPAFRIIAQHFRIGQCPRLSAA
jgi:hypothetical protein